MSLARAEKITAEEFVVWAMHRPERYELVDGHVVKAMTGARQSHNVVVSNILIAIGPQLKRGGCRTTAKDTAVRTGPHGVRYPDMVVDCGPPDPSALMAREPRVVFEIASPSTTFIDATDKLDATDKVQEYQALGSIRTVVLVEPDVVMVKVYRRDGGGWTVERYADRSAIVALDEGEADLAVADIYDTLEPSLQADGWPG